jgi:hypothetical protein
MNCQPSVILFSLIASEREDYLNEPAADILADIEKYDAATVGGFFCYSFHVGDCARIIGEALPEGTLYSGARYDYSDDACPDYAPVPYFHGAKWAMSTWTTKWHMTEAGSTYTIGICDSDTPIGVYPADEDNHTSDHVVIDWRRPGEPREADFIAARISGDFVFAS